MSNEGMIQWKVEVKPTVMRPNPRSIYAGVSITENLSAFVSLSAGCDGLPEFRLFSNGKGLARCPYAKRFQKFIQFHDDNEQPNLQVALADFCADMRVTCLTASKEQSDAIVSANIKIDVVDRQSARQMEAFEWFKSSALNGKILAQRNAETPWGALAYYVRSLPQDGSLDPLKAGDSLEPVYALLNAILATGIVERDKPRRERERLRQIEVEQVVAVIEQMSDTDTIDVLYGFDGVQAMRKAQAIWAVRHGGRLVHAATS